MLPEYDDLDATALADLVHRNGDMTALVRTLKDSTRNDSSPH